MRRIIIALSLLFLISCSSDIGNTRTFAIAVALDYREEGSNANALGNPPNDASSFIDQVELLSPSGHFEKHLFLHADGKKTVNGREEEWSEESIISTIQSLDPSPDDLILFFYSGHGDGNGSLVLSNRKDDKELLEPDELLSALSSVSGKKCVFLDSCYSGCFVEDLGILADGEIFGDNGYLSEDSFLSSVIPALSLAFTAGWSGNGDIWVMSAATDSQLSYDSGTDGLPNQKKYGAFTYYLLSALGYDMESDAPGTSNDRPAITFLGLYDDMKEMMPESLWDMQTPQITLTPLDLVLF